MAKGITPLIKPSHVLGFLLPCVWLAFFLLAIYESKLLGNTSHFDLDKAHWVVLVGVVFAVSGWIVSAYITLRNSIKQHTINTLLQSRLSATYMENVRNANKRYFSMSGITPVSREEILNASPDSQLPALGYLLNYLEFVAVGIRNGDLDEKVMKQTFRGMVCSLREVGNEYVLYTREAVKLENRRNAPCVTSGRPPENVIYEHLDWLYDRWYDPNLRRPHLNPKANKINASISDLIKVGFKIPTSLEDVDRTIGMIDQNSEVGKDLLVKLNDLRATMVDSKTT